MVHLPIARRELLVHAKSPELYRGRIIASLVLLFLAAGLWVLYNYGGGAGGTAQLLQTTSFILFIMCFVAGAQATADSLSKEKREGTLGLLFLTGLRPFEIIFGKLVANSLTAFYGVLITFPVLSIALIMGGVHGAELIKAGLAILNTLFVSACIGIFASSLVQKRTRAHSIATWTLLFLWFGVLLLQALAVHYKASSSIQHALQVLNLNYALSVAFSGLPGSSFWLSIGVTHLVGWIFLFLSTIILPRRWQEQGARGKGVGIRDRWRQFCYGQGASRRSLRQRLLDRNPYFWISARNRMKPASIWFITLGFLGLMAAILRMDIFNGGALAAVLIVTSFIHRGLVSSYASARMIDEHEQGTLEMLLSTPFTVRELIRGQMMAVARNFGGPALLVVVLHLAAVALAAYGQAVPGTMRAMYSFALIGIAATYLLDLFALAHLGLWSVITTKQTRNAAGSAMAACFFLPVLLFAITVAGAGLLSWYTGFSLRFPPWAYFALWFMITITNSTFWIVMIRRALPAKLRQFALKRYSPPEKKSFLDSLHGAASFLMRRNRPAS